MPNTQKFLKLDKSLENWTVGSAVYDFKVKEYIEKYSVLIV
jgi:hypothetical protein